MTFNTQEFKATLGQKARELVKSLRLEGMVDHPDNNKRRLSKEEQEQLLKQADEVEGAEKVDGADPEDAESPAGIRPADRTQNEAAESQIKKGDKVLNPRDDDKGTVTGKEGEEIKIKWSDGKEYNVDADGIEKSSEGDFDWQLKESAEERS